MKIKASFYSVIVYSFNSVYYSAAGCTHSKKLFTLVLFSGLKFCNSRNYECGEKVEAEMSDVLFLK